MKRFGIYFLLFISSIAFLKAQNYKQENSSEILLDLQKLNTVGSVLYIAAHPDDENTRLLGYLANGKHLRTAYLALTRGDGGQNLIGSEKAELLGMIRTQELLAARRTDRAEQFFTRANDFGFSKGPEETLKIWNKDSILKDVVWAIRKFRPDVIITRFPDDGSGGHGHHTASALLAQEAFDAAADSTRFPELNAYVKPWQTKRLYWNHWGRWRNQKADLSGLLTLEVGEFNPLLGKSYGELAAQSRSMHKSQGFGAAEVRGSQTEYFKYIKGDSAKKSLFEGIDFSWNRVPQASKVGKIVQDIIKNYNPQYPEKSIKALAQIHKILKNNKDFYAQQKLAEVEKIIVQCAGLFLEARSTEYITTAGSKADLVISALNRSDADIELVVVGLNVNYKYKTFKNTHFVPSKLVNNKLETLDTMLIEIPENATVTNPYWLYNELGGNNIDNVIEGNVYNKMISRYSIQNQNQVGKPEEKAPFIVTFQIAVDGITFNVERPMIYKWVDPVEGEQSRNLIVAPDITLTPLSKVVMMPNHAKVDVKLTLQSNINDAKGKVYLSLPQGWKSEPESIDFTNLKKGDAKEIAFQVSPTKAGNVSSDPFTVNAIAEINGKKVSYSQTIIDYKHIPLQIMFPPAQIGLVPLDIQTAGKKIGYIPGAGDEIPSSLRNIGFEVDVIAPDKIGQTELKNYDAIITGVRAYNVNEQMPMYYDNLMNYVKNGGNLIVQYNTINFISKINGDIGPYPFKITRDRVTDEEASVNFDAKSPALNKPNKITSNDFKDWIQERGLYFAEDIDPKYSTPLTMNDPGEKPNKGSLLIANYGKGHFVYTGLSFFRELPAGVPGAYRLFINLLSL